MTLLKMSINGRINEEELGSVEWLVGTECGKNHHLKDKLWLSKATLDLQL